LQNQNKLNPAALKYFGEVARNYDSSRAGKQVTVEDDLIIEKFLDTCDRDCVIADIPAGTGRAALSILNRGFSYIGIDFSEDMLDICRRRIGENPKARLLQGDARLLPLNNKEVDNLLSVKFIKWLPTNEMVVDCLREFRRVCKGRVLLNIKVSEEDTDGEVLSTLIRALKRFLTVFKTRRKIEQRKLTAEAFEEMCRVTGWSIAETFENPVARHVRFYILK
jgi:ubiquinone/menaquinone biosynthesis C-methylase UbiE